MLNWSSSTTRIFLQKQFWDKFFWSYLSSYEYSSIQAVTDLKDLKDSAVIFFGSGSFSKIRLLFYPDKNELEWKAS